MKLVTEQLLAELVRADVYDVVGVRLAGIIGAGICAGLLMHDAFEGLCLLLLDGIRFLCRLAKRFTRSGRPESRED